jgi:hypothetical protein
MQVRITHALLAPVKLTSGSETLCHIGRRGIRVFPALTALMANIQSLALLEMTEEVENGFVNHVI